MLDQMYSIADRMRRYYCGLGTGKNSYSWAPDLGVRDEALFRCDAE